MFHPPAPINPYFWLELEEAILFTCSEHAVPRLTMYLQLASLVRLYTEVDA